MTKYKAFAIVAGMLFWILGTAIGQVNAPPTPRDPNQINPRLSHPAPVPIHPETSATNPDQQTSSSSSQTSEQAVTEVQKAFQKNPALAQSGIGVRVGSNSNTLVLTGTVQSQAKRTAPSR